MVFVVGTVAREVIACVVDRNLRRPDDRANIPSDERNERLHRKLRRFGRRVPPRIGEHLYEHRADDEGRLRDIALLAVDHPAEHVSFVGEEPSISVVPSDKHLRTRM